MNANFIITDSITTLLYTSINGYEVSSLNFCDAAVEQW